MKLESGEENAILDVPIASRDDTGKYTVCLSNQFGEDEGDVNVVVLGQSHRLPSLLSIDTNVLKILCNLDKPGAPDDVVVSEIFADNCQLSWKPPTDNGGADIQGK